MICVSRVPNTTKHAPPWVGFPRRSQPYGKTRAPEKPGRCQLLVRGGSQGDWCCTKKLPLPVASCPPATLAEIGGKAQGFVLVTKLGVSNATKACKRDIKIHYRDRQDIVWTMLRRQHTKCASHCLRRTSPLQTALVSIFCEEKVTGPSSST